MRLRRSLLAVLASAVALTWLPAQPALATPIQGQTPWSVLLCKFADHSEEPKDPQYFKDLFTTEGLGKGGLADFIAEQSRGRASMAGSVVKGWFPMSVTAEQWKAQSPEARVKSCTNTANPVPANHRLAVMVNAPVGLDAKVPLAETTLPVVLDPPLWDLATVTAHVLNRSGLSYPRSTLWRSPSSPVWTAPGQYDDPWDTLSNPNIHAAPSQRFGRGTVGLSGPHLDELGWLPGDRVVTLGKDGVATRTIKLAPLERPDLPGALLVRVPTRSYTPDNLSDYYTVEFRKKTGQSAGVPNDVVLIHNYYRGRPYLTRSITSHAPMQALDVYGITVTIDSVTQDYATVTVSSAVTTTCLAGYVHREAVADDKVCVTPAVHEQTLVDNEDAPRWVDYETGGCLHVRRERLITPDDHVCITPETEQQIIADNQAAPSRTNPARNVWGPNTCTDNYVWRQADASDYVCVTMETRLQTLEDNAAAASRWTDGPFGPRTCVQGYVWREAFLGDQVCVTGDRRTQARQDNNLAHTRVHWPTGGAGEN
ncbi:hypothetical protein [Streptosporangium sp. NPDC002607]